MIQDTSHSMMTLGRIDYFEPIGRTLSSVKRILFQPFAIGKWFALGFSAWLAGLLGGGSSFNGNFSTGSDSTSDESASQVGAWLQEHMALVIGIGSIVVIVCLAIYVVLTWLQSRGKFMFLDNLVHNRSAIQEPWGRFKRLGDSLFLWTLVFQLLAFALLLLTVGAIGSCMYLGFRASVWSGAIILVGLFGLLSIVLLMIVYGYIATMLEDFVIPIMYQHDLTTREAWARFLGLHNAAIGTFVLYALIRALLGMVTSMALLTLGLVTCCIGLLLMAIPYIGAVLTLPVSAGFRLLGPEFLRQFGREYDLFSSIPPNQNPATAP